MADVWFCWCRCMVLKFVVRPMHASEILSDLESRWYIFGMSFMYYYYFNYMWPMHGCKICADADAWSQNLSWGRCMPLNFYQTCMVFFGNVTNVLEPMPVPATPSGWQPEHFFSRLSFNRHLQMSNTCGFSLWFLIYLTKHNSQLPMMSRYTVLANANVYMPIFVPMPTFEIFSRFSVGNYTTMLEHILCL